MKIEYNSGIESVCTIDEYSRKDFHGSREKSSNISPVTAVFSLFWI